MRKNLSTLKKSTWKVFSEYIRRRDKGICFTCGKKDDWKKTDAGHYIPGSVCGLYLYFSEINVNCQCTACNRFRHGNLSQYALALERKHGKGILQQLEKERVKHKKLVYNEDDYKKLKIIYQEKIKAL